MNTGDPAFLKIDRFTMQPVQMLNLDSLAAIWTDPEVTRFT
ncbi:MAG: hypothetical protein SWJ54_01870 [Cyanobacteriota bacterium]|nr:hypothetical protein [Cyanobacteriota bacterium]